MSGSILNQYNVCNRDVKPFAARNSNKNSTFASIPCKILSVSEVEDDMSRAMRRPPKSSILYRCSSRSLVNFCPQATTRAVRLNYLAHAVASSL